MFGTSGIRGPVGEVVSVELGAQLGGALGDWGAERVVIGRDARASGEYLAGAVGAGLRERGVEVIDVGLAATPTVARSVDWKEADAGVVVTASHNPAADNGFKCWLPSGQAFPPAKQRELETRMGADALDTSPVWEYVPAHHTWSRAAETHVSEITKAVEIDRSLEVVLDLGNGVGQVTADALHAVGCHVITLNGQPDGRFPGRPSEPTPANCNDLCATVPAVGADLGIAHDGDADRMLAVDENGRFITGDILLALLATRAIEPGETVAVPVDTSLAVSDAVTAAGGEVVRTRVGDVFVADEASKDGVGFGGEPSGAWIWPNETLCPDGPLAALKLAEIVSREESLADVVDQISTYPIRRSSIPIADKPGVMRRVTETVGERYGEVSTIDGVRVELDNGWILIRPSGTEPIVRVTAEAREPMHAEELLTLGEHIVESAQQS